MSDIAHTGPLSAQQFARLILQCLQDGNSVDMEGLGRFVPQPDGHFRFEAQGRPHVFIAYAVEDEEYANRLYHDLRSQGFDPWMDRHKLLPGQNWPRAIERAISVSDFFIPCFSSRSVGKRSTFQSELRYALDCLRQHPLDYHYLLPVRLDSCCVPDRITRDIQYVNLFPDWQQGLDRLVATMRGQA